MLAKTDIHLRLELSAFELFYESFSKAVQQYEIIDNEDDVFLTGYVQIEGLALNKNQFIKTCEFAKSLTDNHEEQHQVTLVEVYSMKQYCEFYFLTLSVRKFKNEKSLRITSN